MSSEAKVTKEHTVPDSTVLRFHGLSRSPSAIPMFSSPEHNALGDSISLQFPNEVGPNQPVQKVPSSSFKFSFKEYDSTLNDQLLTYGQIGALAGDFYGTYEPISGKINETQPDETEKTKRFLKAWNLLAKEPKSVPETRKILKLDEEVESQALKDWEQYAKDHGLPMSWIFATKTWGASWIGNLKETLLWSSETDHRTKKNGYDDDYPGYIGLLLNNFDHFGKDAHTAYKTGHKVALTIAANGKGNIKKLKLAYAMNAFADHYLEDSFSGGHIRTPRRALRGGALFGIPGTHYTWPVRDLCANKMHDEDSALGIRVRNKRPGKPDNWVCYGDDYMADEKGADNKRLSHEAVQASADEIWDAWLSGEVKSEDDFQGLLLAPTIESAQEVHLDMLAPLFKVDEKGSVYRRSKDLYSVFSRTYDLARRKWDDSNYTWWFDFTTTLGLLVESGYWNYPMQYDEASPANAHPPPKSLRSDKEEVT